MEDLLAERGILVPYEGIRRWCQRFGPEYPETEATNGTWTRSLFGINGEQQYLWRTVDPDGDIIDILIQPHRDQRTAERFFPRPLLSQGAEPKQIVG